MTYLVYLFFSPAGRIDHGHHANSAYNALHDAVEMANAVAKAVEMTKEGTLFIRYFELLYWAGYPKKSTPV